MTEWLLLGAVVALIAANGLFVLAEFAFITVDRATVERHAEASDKRAAGLLNALTSLSTQLSGAQLGITVTSLVVGFIAEPSLAAILRGPLGLTGWGESSVTAVSVTLALVIATFVQMVFGELVPKNWAIAEPLRMGRLIAGPQLVFVAWTSLPIRFFNGSANKILHLFGIEPTEELASARSPQELSSLVHRSGQEGTLDASTAQFVTRSIGLVGKTAADVMTPRPRVRFLSADDPVSVVLATTAETGHARFPIMGEDFDDVLGFVHFKQALGVPVEDRPRHPIRAVMVPVAQVPETMELETLLVVLREPGLQMAVVIDEYGGTAGIVTFEDLVEEIVGEIDDEQDPHVREHRRADDGSWILSGLLRPDEVSDIVGLQLPEAEQSETLGGLLTERLDRLPEVDDSVTVPVLNAANADGDGVMPPAEITMTVTRLDGRRVDRVRLVRVPTAPEGGDDVG